MSVHGVPNRMAEGGGAATARGNRIEAAAVLVIAALVLVLAWIMQPSPAGFGTHEQLFIIPCPFRWLSGLPCPMCGMTTAFTLMARGDVLSALSAHVLGPGVYLATWGLAGAALTGLVRGTPPLPRWVVRADAARMAMVLIGVGWLVNLARHLFGA
ncbi:MAG: DUF2752 domain-containing protein [Armatimonadota bacterium]